MEPYHPAPACGGRAGNRSRPTSALVSGSGCERPRGWPVDRASRGANRTRCPASDPRSSRQWIPAAGLCPGRGMVRDCGGRLPGQCHDLGGLALRKGLVLSHVDHSGSLSGRSGSRRHSSGVNIALVRELIETEEASARLEARGGVSAGPKTAPRACSSGADSLTRRGGRGGHRAQDQLTMFLFCSIARLGNTSAPNGHLLARNILSAGGGTNEAVSGRLRR